MPTEGTVSKLQLSADRGTTLLRFVLEREGGERVPVVLRARRVEGLVHDGDRVELPDPEEGALRGADGIARPERLRNLTTASDVYPGSGRAQLAGAHVSVASNMGKTAASTLVTLAVTGLVGAVAGLGGSGGGGNTSTQNGGGSCRGCGGGGPSGGSSSNTDTGLAIFLAVTELVVLLGLAYVFIGRRWRAQGRAFWPVAVGIVIAVALVNTVLAIA